MNETSPETTTTTATAKHPFEAGWQAGQKLDAIERGIETLLNGIEALEAIAEAGRANGCSQEARGLGWVVSRLGDDTLAMQRDLEAFRPYFEAVVPEAGAAAARLAKLMADATGVA